MLNADQRSLLTKLGEYSEAPTARRLADDLESPENYSRLYGYDAVLGKLKRLEKREFVSRDGRRPAHWSLTDAGRSELGLGL